MALCVAIVCALLEVAGHGTAAKAQENVSWPRRLENATHGRKATDSSNGSATGGSNETGSSTASDGEDLSCSNLDEDSKDYDGQQWLAVCAVLRPEKLQPWYLMPVMMGGKLLATLYIFGFDLKFKPPPPDSRFQQVKRIGTQIAKTLGSLVFLGMAVNCYYHDFMDFHNSEITGFWRSGGVMMIVWATSPNYVAALTIWSSFSYQSPMCLLDLKQPEYLDIPYAFGVPVVPGSAKWLPPLKHIYAFVLFPYFLPKYIGVVVQSFAYIGWCCITRCGPICGICKAACCCAWSLIGVIFTFGLWGAAKNTLTETWSELWPIYYITVMELWALMVAPLVMAFLYGILICADCDKILNGVLLALTPAITIGPDDIETLKKINAKELQADFRDALNIDDMEEQLEQLRNQSKDLEESLLDTKVVIYYKTLQSMSEVILFQLLWVVLVRLLTTKTAEGYAMAMKLTVVERHAATWFNSLMKLGTGNISTALDTMWRFLG